MLEKYSNDLEDIVKERTVELEEEKKKTDLLLFRIVLVYEYANCNAAEFKLCGLIRLFRCATLF